MEVHQQEDVGHDNNNGLHNEAISEFRKRVKDLLTSELAEDDTFLMRWLIAREYNVDKAFVMLENYLKWRKDYEMDEILDWVPPEDLQRLCPYEISFHDRDGRPVLLFPWGSWTPWEFIDKGRKEEYTRYMYQMLERCVAAIQKPAQQFVILADSSGFAYWHMTKMKTIEVNLEVLRGFESRYPEMMNLAIAINCPKVFSLFFAIIRPLMSTRTHEKLQIYDANSAKWMPRLSQYISQEELPKKYGGQKGSILIREKNKKEVINCSLEAVEALG